MLESIWGDNIILLPCLAAIFTILMLLVARAFFRRIIAHVKEKDGHRAATFRSIWRMLNVFFVVLGLGIAAYGFFEGDRYEVLHENIQRVVWIAFIALATRIGVALSRSYFRLKIEAAYASDQVDATTYKFLNSLTTIFIYIVGLSLAAYSIPDLRFMAQSALTGAGMIALIIGVASQEAISNIVSGAFIVAFKPFQIGHIIQVGSVVKGVVEDLTLRHTVIRDFQNRRVVIPNSIINKEPVTNFNLGEVKIIEYLEVGISYDSDVDLALSIVQEAAEAHPLILDNRTEEEVKEAKPIADVRVVAWADSSVNLRAYLWANSSGDGVLMKHQLLKIVKQKFEENGIEIPFPHRVVILKNTKEDKDGE